MMNGDWNIKGRGIGELGANIMNDVDVSCAHNYVMHWP